MINGLATAVLTITTIFSNGSVKVELKGIYYAEYSVNARAVCIHEGKKFLPIKKYEKDVLYRAFSCGV